MQTRRYGREDQRQEQIDNINFAASFARSETPVTEN